MYPLGVWFGLVFIVPIFWYTWPPVKQRLIRRMHTRRDIRALRKAKSIDLSQLGAPGRK